MISTSRDTSPLTIRLWAQNFYRVIVDEGEARINYHAIEILKFQWPTYKAMRKIVSYILQFI